MLTASQVYTYTRRILDAYTVVMQPLSAELDMAPNAVDILLFLANNPGLDTARDICTYRRLKPGIVSFHVDKLVREGYLLRARDPGERFKRLRGVAPDALETFQRCLTAFAQNLDHIAYGEAL